MEKKTVIKIRYWALMKEIINSFHELSEKFERMEEDSIDTALPCLYSTSLAPLALMEKKLEDLSRHIQQYARKSLPLILNLRKIDRQLANSNLLPDRTVMIADLHRITDNVVRDIKRKQSFLGDFLDPANTHNMAFSIDHADMFEELREVCTQIYQTLDTITEHIHRFSKYTTPELVLHSSGSKKERRTRMLRKASAVICSQW